MNMKKLPINTMVKKYMFHSHDPTMRPGLMANGLSIKTAKFTIITIYKAPIGPRPTDASNINPRNI